MLAGWYVSIQFVFTALLCYAKKTLQNSLQILSCNLYHSKFTPKYLFISLRTVFNHYQKLDMISVLLSVQALQIKKKNEYKYENFN